MEGLLAMIKRGGYHEDKHNPFRDGVRGRVAITPNTYGMQKLGSMWAFTAVGVTSADYHARPATTQLAHICNRNRSRA